MKVVHVVRQYAPAIGGIESFVRQLCQAVAAHGVCSEVVTLNRLFTDPSTSLPSQEVIDGIRVQRIPYVGGRRFFVAPGVLRALGDADVIHVHAIDFFLDFLAATRVLHRKPIVVSTHGGFFHTSFLKRVKQAVFHTVTKASLSKASRIVAVSRSDHEIFGRITKRVELIENGADVSRFLRLAKEPIPGRWLYVGRISPSKRLDRVLETMGYLVRVWPHLHLDVVGPDEHGLTDVLKSMADRLGLARHVCFHGRVSEADLDRLQSTAECLVMASEYEGFGIAAIEGMAAGTVPILSDIPCFRAFVRDNENGLLVNFGDPERAAQEISSRLPRLLEQYDKVSLRAREAAKSYDWSVVALKWVELYHDVKGRERRVILGVPITVTTSPALIRLLGDGIRTRSPRYLAFANAHTLNLAVEDQEFLQILRRFTVVNDGLGVDLASKRLYGERFQENLNGTDFVPYFLRSLGYPVRVYLLGSREGVAQAAGEALVRCCPNVKVSGTHHGYFSVKETSRVIDAINAARPDVLLVAFGNPLQEKWIARYADVLSVPVCIGVGALFDFLSGRQPRAPRWVRLLRSEWCFRLMVEPRRMWRRYILGNVVFLRRVAVYGHISPLVAHSPTSRVISA